MPVSRESDFQNGLHFISIRNLGHYPLDSPFSHLSGVYRCIARNENGETSMEATIKVERSQSPPHLAIEPSNLAAITGTTIELPCQADQPEDGLQVNSLTRIGHGIGNFLFTRHLLTFPFGLIFRSATGKNITKIGG